MKFAATPFCAHRRCPWKCSTALRCESGRNLANVGYKLSDLVLASKIQTCLVCTLQELAISVARAHHMQHMICKDDP
jgi:hypothetical protein